MWSFIVTDTLSGAVLNRSLPLAEAKFGDHLAAKGQLTGLVSLRNVGVTDDLLQPWRRVIWPAWHGEPWNPYVIVQWPANDPTATSRPIVAIRADLALMDKRVIRHDLNFTNVDQLDIFRDLWRYGAGQLTQFSAPLYQIVMPNDFSNPWPVLFSAQIPWVTLGTNKSGKLRTRKAVPGDMRDGYPADARRLVGTCLQQLLDLEGGFERRLNCTLDSSGEPTARIELGYPRVGNSTPVVSFEYPGGNVISAQHQVDGAAFGNRWDYLGDEVNGARRIGTGLDRGSINAGYPLLEEVRSASDVNVASALRDKAKARLTGHPVETWACVIDPGRSPGWGDYALGDYVRLRVRAAQGVREETLRIVGLDVDAANPRRPVVTPVLQAADEVTDE